MKNFYSLFKKDCQMMIAGKFIFVAFGSLLIYTLFINFGYINFMDMQLYNVYLYDPQGTQQEVSELIRPVASLEELDDALLADTNGQTLFCISEAKRLIITGLTMRYRFFVPVMSTLRR